MGAVRTEPLLPTVLWCIGILLGYTAVAFMLWTQFKAAVATVCIVEAAYAAYFWLLEYPAINAQPVQHTPHDDDPDKTVREVLKAIRKTVGNIFEFLEQWSLGSRYEDMGRENVLDLMSYAVWYRTRQEMERSGLLPAADDLLAKIEKLFHISIPPGVSPKPVQWLTHLWHPVPLSYKPLSFYLGMEALAGLSHILLTLLGFHYTSVNGTACYIANMRSSSGGRFTSTGKQQTQGKSAVPLVFLHGVGIGLLGYLLLLRKLVATGRPLIVPCAKHVSMRLIQEIPTVDDMAAAVWEVLAAHNIKRAAVMGHSYGSLVASRLLQNHPSCVEALVLVDPVCFHMYLPGLVKRFLFQRQFDSGNLLLDSVMTMVSKEVHCTASFCRNFFWTNYNLWASDLPSNCLVALSGRDVLVDAALLKDWLLQDTTAQVLYGPSQPHAGCQTDSSWQDQIISQVELLMDTVAKRPVPVAGKDSNRLVVHQ